MANRDPNTFTTEDKLAAQLERQGQKIARRGLLARAGRFILRLSGVAAITLLPVDRRANAQTASGSCDWTACGMCGYFCQACCGGSRHIFSCPSCMNTHNWWTGCCTDPGCGQKYLVTFTDCGSNASANNSACQSASSCGTGCTALGFTDPQHATFYRSSSYPSDSYSCTVITMQQGHC
jgi:hypothetical protein